MGGKYQVTVWHWDAEREQGDDMTEYLGNSFWAAVRAFWKNRNSGTGCVSFIYRRK